MDGFSFAEGALWLWTGQAPSTEVAYVQNASVNLVRGYVNQQTVNGDYFDIATGQRANVSFTPVFTPDVSLLRIFNQSTAVHMKLNHVQGGVSAGIILYSGRFDQLSMNGNEGQVMTMPMTYHANVWSAYGQ
jgi:hypothetical protein